MFVIAAGVALLGFAPAPLPRQQRQREDQADVTGTWRFVLWEENGQRDQKAEAAFQVRMTTEEFAFVAARGGKDGGKFVMCLEPQAAPPAFTWSRSDFVRFVGSYRIQGGEITMIFNRGYRLGQRPTDFAGKAENRFVLRRVAR
jgi:uncharacterized protein (TIGR03067 family)